MKHKSVENYSTEEDYMFFFKQLDLIVDITQKSQEFRDSNPGGLADRNGRVEMPDSLLGLLDGFLGYLKLGNGIT